MICLSILGTHEIFRSNSIGVWQPKTFRPLEQYVRMDALLSQRFQNDSFQFHLHIVEIINRKL